jgi:hypothetical protein
VKRANVLWKPFGNVFSSFNDADAKGTTPTYYSQSKLNPNKDVLYKLNSMSSKLCSNDDVEIKIRFFLLAHAVVCQGRMATKVVVFGVFEQKAKYDKSTIIALYPLRFTV